MSTDLNLYSYARFEIFKLQRTFNFFGKILDFPSAHKQSI